MTKRLPIVEIHSPNYTVPTTPRVVRWIVLHTTESPERENAARGVAKNWFARPDAKASAHYVVDSREIVRCVREDLIAWHARGCNAESIGVEIVGAAGQDARSWADDYSIATLQLTARLVADIAARHWPARSDALGPIDESLLRAGVGGVTTHAAVSGAFGKSDHWDPGPAFPMAWFLDRVAYYSHAERG